MSRDNVTHRSRHYSGIYPRARHRIGARSLKNEGATPFEWWLSPESTSARSRRTLDALNHSRGPRQGENHQTKGLDQGLSELCSKSAKTNFRVRQRRVRLSITAWTAVPERLCLVGHHFPPLWWHNTKYPRHRPPSALARPTALFAIEHKEFHGRVRESGGQSSFRGASRPEPS